MKRRTLTLSAERLAELGPADLAQAVAGGDTTSTCDTGFTVCGLCDIEFERPLPTHHRALGC